MLRITAKAETKDEAIKLIEPIEEEIKNRLGDNVYATEDINIEEVVARLLIEKKTNNIYSGIMYWWHDSKLSY